MIKQQLVLIFLVVGMVAFSSCVLTPAEGEALADLQFYATDSVEYSRFKANPTYRTCNDYVDGYETLVQKLLRLIPAGVQGYTEGTVRGLRTTCSKLL